MKISVIRGKELKSPEIERWRELQKADPLLTTPYFCPDFTQAVAAVRHDVYVGVLEQSNQILGFFPFQRGRSRVGRPVGGALSDFHGMIGASELRVSARALLKSCGITVWNFNHLVSHQRSFQSYHHTLSNSPYMDLSSGYESYATERRKAGSKQIKKTGNLRRKLEREVGTLRVELHVADDHSLRRLISWKSDQYRESGLTDIFTYDWITALLTQIHHTRNEYFGGLLSVLYANDEMIAAHMGMRSRSVLHYWFPAYERRFAHYSPGLILLLEIAEHCESLGIQKIDLGKGDALYKDRLMSGSVPLAEGSLEFLPLIRTAKRVQRGVKNWTEGSPLSAAARIPTGIARRIRYWIRFR